MKKFFWLIFGLFFVSRFFFLANYPHFYDSPEYFRESLSNNFFISLSQSHESIHPIYLFLTQLFQRIIPGQNVWELSLIAAIFGLISVIAFYLLVKRNFDEKVALFSLIPLIFFPHLWLIQTNVLHESLDIGFFLLSLLFFDFFLERKKIYWWVLTVIFLSLAIFDFVGILLWLPVFIGLTVLRSKKINWASLNWSMVVIVLSFVLAVGGLYPISHLKVLLFDYGGGGIFSNWRILDILRMLRNDVFILFYGYSIAAILGLIIGGFYLLKEKKWLLVVFLLSFFMPFMISGKFWYGGLFGRYSALIAYPLALLLGIMPWPASPSQGGRKIYCLLMAILFLSFLPTFMVYQKTPIPIVQAGLIEKIDLKEDDILVLSDYQRPQLTYANALYLGGDAEQQKMIEGKIAEKLVGDGRVFISQQAVNFPYWQYDGQQIHIISKGNKNKAQLEEFLSDKEKKLVVEDKNYSLLNLYQLQNVTPFLIK